MTHQSLSAANSSSRTTSALRDIAMSGDISMAALITQLYAFGAIKGVEWSDPEWKAMREQDAAEAAAHG
jgi:hypothetical protein